jgi:hypothetical protein
MKANPLHDVPDSRTVKAPEAGVAVGSLVMALLLSPARARAAGCASLARTPNGKRGAALEMAYGCARGAKLWRANPRSGTGMKQGRQAWGGGKRQEVAKT